MRDLRAVVVLCLVVGSAARSQVAAPRQPRSAYVDSAGVIRWQGTREEVALFGANYTLPSASDYRAAGYLGGDRKRMVDEDLAHFARMGWDGMRLALWGDWENSDSAGNLRVNDHLDLFDYAIARARERGISVLFSPIQTYNANWPDALPDTTSPGFANHFTKCELGTNDRAIAAQTNYLRQILNHVNPYTHTALKNEPAILFVEMINEPCHHSDDLAGSVRYINALVDAVRSTGSTQILFHNVSQDFQIAAAIGQSKVQGATFGWYPTGLNSGHELTASYLRTVDDYAPMRIPELASRPRIVYEFDSPDLRTGYMYPAMVRAFRSVGAQFAAMFAYDMLQTASRNLGWQTHYLNLVYTPRKAMSAIIAAEAMRRLPRLRSYGGYPENTHFGDFRVSAEENQGELVAPDALLYAGSTRSEPPDRARLRRVAGHGSSPVVTYDGDGIYFLDRVRTGVWRLEVYPDAVPVRDPFEMPNRDKVVTRAIHRAWPMTVDLPDLGASFSVQPITGSGAVSKAEHGRFVVMPGVYVLSASGAVARNTLPALIGHVGFNEFHAPPPDTMPVAVVLLTAGDHPSDRPVEIAARVVNATPPGTVTLWMRAAGAGRFRPFMMQASGGYEYRATIPVGTFRDGVYDYVISVVGGGDTVTTFPDGLHRRPSNWDFGGQRFWSTRILRPDTPLRLFTPAEDVGRLAFTRIGDAGRQGLFRLVVAANSGEPALHVELPLFNGNGPDDYTTSLVVKDRIGARGDGIGGARGLVLRARGIGPRQVLHVTLVERDGTAWSAAVSMDSAWAERVIGLADLRPARSAMLPQGFPGEWNYWLSAATGRGGSGDAIRIADVERLQLSLRREPGLRPAAGTYGVEVERVMLILK